MVAPLIAIAGKTLLSLGAWEAGERAFKWVKSKMTGDVTKPDTDMEKLDPEVAIRAQALIDLFAEVGIPLIITEGYRSQARQDFLYSQGRTSPGPIVTWTRSSKHTEGKAFDIGIKGFNPDAVPRRLWQYIGTVGEAMGLKWGGRFRGRDYVHFEMG